MNISACRRLSQMRQHLLSHASVTYALCSASVGAKQVPLALSSLQGRNPHCINEVCAMGVFRSQTPRAKKREESLPKMPVKYQMIAESDATYDSEKCHHERRKCPKILPHLRNRLHIRQSTCYNLFACRYIMASV